VTLAVVWQTPFDDLLRGMSASMLVLGLLLASASVAGGDAGADDCYRGACLRPVPEKYRQSISDAVRLGKMIFEQDEVSARATDSLYARAPEEQRAPTIRGWSTLPGPWWRVSFFVVTGKDIAVGYEIDVPAAQRGACLHVAADADAFRPGDSGRHVDGRG
jgi:hypothetical protein